MAVSFVFASICGYVRIFCAVYFGKQINCINIGITDLYIELFLVFKITLNYELI